MSKIPSDYIDIEPTDPRHRQVIAAALKAKDTEALAALKNNTHKPIRFVIGGFTYLLMLTSWEGNHEDDCVVIYGLEARQTVEKLARLHMGEDDPEPDPITIPLDTYDFLL